MSDPLPLDAGAVAFRNQLVEFGERMKAEQQEHERRMREDPAYRAQQEAIAAERLAEEAATDRRRLEEARRALAKHRQACGIPEFTWAYLDAFRAGRMEAPGAAAEALHWVERFLSSGKPEWRFLLLAGAPGLGKTVAAARFADAPVTTTETYFHSTQTIVREVASQFVTAEALSKLGTFGEGAQEWEAIRNASRLVVDDLGVERLDDKGWALANLLGLFSHRHAHGLPTVITTNLGRSEFEARYCAADGGRLRDRLAESGWWMPLEGQSLRRRLALGGPMTP